MNLQFVRYSAACIFIGISMASCEGNANSENAYDQVITNEKANDNSGSLSPDRVNMSPVDTTYTGGSQSRFRLSVGSGNGNSAGTIEAAQ